MVDIVFAVCLIGVVFVVGTVMEWAVGREDRKLERATRRRRRAARIIGG
jgi:hypothetical protein